jgi:Flp pilus assembly pilin Flp
MLVRALQFWRNQDGQDLIEYTLILAIFTLLTLALVSGEAPSVNGMWTAMGNHLATGSSFAKGN